MYRAGASLILAFLGLISSLDRPLCAQRLLPSMWEIQTPTAAPDLSALQIVVISGEDAVNIVKKKTAVQPVVEVRDKNNNPVSGVLVNFSTPNQGASAVFSNGSHTLSLVTDNAGRTVVNGMQPAGSGTFHITVTASMQGHVLATATIAQTNFITAAAAAAAGAGGVAAGGGAGAGLSAGVLAAIIAGVAAAAVGTAIALTHGGGGSKSSNTVTIGIGTPTVGAPH